MGIILHISDGTRKTLQGMGTRPDQHNTRSAGTPPGDACAAATAPGSSAEQRVTYEQRQANAVSAMAGADAPRHTNTHTQDTQESEQSVGRCTGGSCRPPRRPYASHRMRVWYKRFHSTPGIAGTKRATTPGAFAAQAQ